MPKVKINSDDYRRFEEAAEAAGTTVDLWLAEAGRAQALKAAHGASRVTLPRSDRLTDTWGDTLLDLAAEIRSTQELAYVTLLQLHTIINDTALFVAPDAFTRDVVESRLRGRVADALSRRLDRPVDIAVTLARPATRRPEATKASGNSQPSQGETQNTKRVPGPTDPPHSSTTSARWPPATTILPGSPNG